MSLSLEEKRESAAQAESAPPRAKTTAVAPLSDPHLKKRAIRFLRSSSQVFPAKNFDIVCFSVTCLDEVM